MNANNTDITCQNNNNNNPQFPPINSLPLPTTTTMTMLQERNNNTDVELDGNSFMTKSGSLGDEKDKANISYQHMRIGNTTTTSNDNDSESLLYNNIHGFNEAIDMEVDGIQSTLVDHHITPNSIAGACYHMNSDNNNNNNRKASSGDVKTSTRASVLKSKSATVLLNEDGDGSNPLSKTSHTNRQLTKSKSHSQSQPQLQSRPVTTTIMEIMPRRNPLPTSVLAAAIEASEIYNSKVNSHKNLIDSNQDTTKPTSKLSTKVDSHTDVRARGARTRKNKQKTAITKTHDNNNANKIGEGCEEKENSNVDDMDHGQVAAHGMNTTTSPLISGDNDNSDEDSKQCDPSFENGLPNEKETVVVRHAGHGMSVTCSAGPIPGTFTLGIGKEKAMECRSKKVANDVLVEDGSLNCKDPVKTDMTERNTWKGIQTNGDVIDVIVDPKRARRIIANRQSAQRSKERKQQYVLSLEERVNELSAKLSAAEEELRLQKGEHELLSIAQIQVQKKLQDCEKRARLRDTIESSLRREIDHLRQANRAICEAANEQGATINIDNSNYHSNFDDFNAKSACIQEGGDSMNEIDVAHHSKPISNVNYDDNDNNNYSNKRGASTSDLVANLNLALSQTAHLFNSNTTSIGSDSRSEDVALIGFDLPNTDWLADLTIPATKYEIDPRTNKIHKSNSGVKRKNTC